MTINPKVAKPGDIITITGPVNRKERGTRMVYEPRVNGNVVGQDIWFADVYVQVAGKPVYNDAAKFDEVGARVGDIVEVTGTVYPYGKGKIGIFNITVKVVGKVPYNTLEPMFDNVPAKAVDAANIEARHTAPKPIINPNGNVEVVGNTKQRRASIARLYR
jgi:hypothetical protein